MRTPERWLGATGVGDEGTARRQRPKQSVLDRDVGRVCHATSATDCSAPCYPLDETRRASLGVSHRMTIHRI